MPMTDLKQRIGPVAGFVDDHVVICGGFSMEEPEVLIVVGESDHAYVSANQDLLSYFTHEMNQGTRVIRSLLIQIGHGRLIAD